MVDAYVFRQLYICMFFNRKERKDLRKVHKDFLLQIIGIIPNFTIYYLFVFYLLSSFLQLTTFSTHNLQLFQPTTLFTLSPHSTPPPTTANTEASIL